MKNRALILSRRNLVYLLLLSLTTWLVFSWWQSNNAPIVYQTTVIKRGHIEEVVAAIGSLSPRLSIEVGAQVSGQINTLAVEPGDVVKKGQLLLEIDASVQQSSVDALRALLAAQQAQLASRQATELLTKQQNNRQQQLAKKGATSNENRQMAVANWKIAVASVDELNAQIKQTHSRLKGDEAQLGYTKIYAPVAGTVLSVEVKKGQTLNATYSTPAVLAIADLSNMTIEAKVAEADISYIVPDMPVWFTTLGNNKRRWYGKVRQVLPAPLVNVQNAGIVFYRVLFDVNNEDGALMSGMTVQVSFITEAAKDVLTVPMNALTEVDEAEKLYSVYILGADGEPEKRDIKIGRMDLLSAEIVEGLQLGEEVVMGTIKLNQRH